MSVNSKTRYILYGHGRTGSSLLGRYINQHPDSLFDGELYHMNKLNELAVWKRFVATNIPKLFLNNKVNSCEKNCYGFSFLFYQFLSVRTSVEMMDKWGWKIIHLQRSNALEQVMSNQVAHLREKWHTYSHDNLSKENQLFKVDKDDALFRLEKILNANEAQKKAMSTVPHIKVQYENDLIHHSQHQQTMDRVFDYLELKPMKIRPPALSRNFSKPYSEIVTNYHEIESAAIEAGLIKR